MDILVKNGDSIFDAFETANKCNEDVYIKIEKGRYETEKTLLIERDNITIEGEVGTEIAASRRIYFDCEKSKGRIVEIDLKKHGITDIGTFGEGPFEDFWLVHDIPKPHMTEYGPGAELFYDNKIMPISRYPEDGFMRITKSLGKEATYFKGKPNGSKEGIFIADDDAVKNWDPKSVFLIGYWYHDWATQRQSIKSIDRESGIIELNEPYHYSGYRDGECYTSNLGAQFYAINVRDAVNKPGAWCIDRTNSVLYIYPYEGQNYIDISCAEDAIYSKNHKNIKISGVNISQCRKSGVYLEACENVSIKNVSVKNVGAWGILGENCTKTCFEDCEVFLTGGGGIGVNGGKRDILEASENIIRRCTVHDIARWHKTYMAAIDIAGVGCTVSGNYIYNVPHFGIVYAGNNHIIEKNEINNACYESNDAGAIYSGRNWTFRGNIIRYNYIHDLMGHENKGCVGLYFDDAVSSAEVYGNMFANIPYIGLLLGGGRDFDIHDNSFFNCNMSIMYDMRAATWKNMCENGGGRLAERLAEIDYRSDIWKKAYPELYTIEENDKLMPLGNKIKNNTVIGGCGFALQSEKLVSITEIEGNEFAVFSQMPERDKFHADWYYIDK